MAWGNGFCEQRELWCRRTLSRNRVSLSLSCRGLCRPEGCAASTACLQMLAADGRIPRRLKHCGFSRPASCHQLREDVMTARCLIWFERLAYTTAPTLSRHVSTQGAPSSACSWRSTMSSRPRSSRRSWRRRPSRPEAAARLQPKLVEEVVVSTGCHCRGQNTPGAESCLPAGPPVLQALAGMRLLAVQG